MPEIVLPPTPRKDAVLAVRYRRDVDEHDVREIARLANGWKDRWNDIAGQCIRDVDVYAMSAREIDIEVHGTELSAAMLQALVGDARAACAATEPAGSTALEFV